MILALKSIFNWLKRILSVVIHLHIPSGYGTSYIEIIDIIYFIFIIWIIKKLIDQIRKESNEEKQRGRFKNYHE